MSAAVSTGAPHTRRSELARGSSAVLLRDPRASSLLQADNHHAVTPRLWLALYLSHFPLQVLGTERAASVALAVISGSGVDTVVVAAGASAESAGVQVHMPASAACALVPNLILVPRDEAAEAAALEGLAAWAGQFTSLVSLVPPHGLLLEIGGSLALFGGLDALLARVRHGLDALGYSARFGIAPTPLGAWLLARAALEEPVTVMHRLAARLAPVPLACLDLPARVLESLRSVGIERFGDCCRLPRDGVARRTDPRLLACLDRALGKRADPRLPYTPPPTFQRRLSLPGEVKDTETLLVAAERLLLELTGYLQTRAGGAQALEWHLAHRRSPATRLTIELVAPSRDAGHLLLLLRERLARVALEEAVVYLGIRVADILPLAPSSQDLFGEEGVAGGDWRALVERLRSRLGRDAVQGLTVSAEHRPEKAWRCCAPGQGAAKASSLADYSGRPLWLLDPPEPLRTVAGDPWLEGRLHLTGGPERIESGWWDGHDIAREYFEALHVSGACYWIYRELREQHAWYLHGVFS
jgi:protein ImuB